MRILLLNQFFWPDSSPTSQLLTDVAKEFVREGHEVSVICADGNYAVADQGEPPAVKVIRVKALPFVRGSVGRVLSYASFYVAAIWRSMALDKPELVITLTTPPLLSLLGNLLKILRGSRHFIWEMDIYPDVAVELGYFRRGGIVARFTGILADWSRRRADGIIALGECMKQRLVARGIPPERIAVAENWADSEAIAVQPRLRQSSNIVVLYSGNFGLAHDMETILSAIRNLDRDARFRFRFVGGGARHKDLARHVSEEHLQSVELRSYVPRELLGDSLAAADIGLVTQSDVCCGAVVPSKVYGLLAAGRPVLYIGPSEATPARIVRQFGCGWHIPCGQAGVLTDLLRHLADHPDEVHTAGQRAREALLLHFDRPLGVARIAGIVGAKSQSPVPRIMPVALDTAALRSQARP
ncbi:glycosyltransferase involved in cell wall biosynthesis [Silvibacterium bohemicum]|uniref:Glycosyltransferase involved in cell wall biosynthesis n=1 Tax=Silvibacterium bohemicum TaxID=1577686 RepID=A0A841JXF2_9BACT|nr:glycosyltransferase family 4 protein [Silvibacterium bohemicum]MBB6143671.1 glycosyltransferase involved in cell wall biosynthesis [Silvibacterium bohemicum]